MGKSFFKSMLMFVSLALASKLTYDYYVRKKKTQQTNSINEVIMFSHGLAVLRKSKYSRCSITQSMHRLLYFLSTPRYTLDICMYVLTNLDIANVIMKMHYKGVKIRMIIDADMAYSSGSYVRKFEKQGIPVRWMKSVNIMHHKFCLIDAATFDEPVTPLVIMGSLNWTNNALNGNWEDVTVTSQEALVAQYRCEFDRLWKQFQPIVGDM